jgi:hypothetical protein
MRAHPRQKPLQPIQLTGTTLVVVLATLALLGAIVGIAAVIR